MKVDLTEGSEMGDRFRALAIAKVLAERARQDEKWGQRNHGDIAWSVILGEEVGEACRAILEEGDVEREVVQIAAVAVAWLEAIYRRQLRTRELQQQGEQHA